MTFRRASYEKAYAISYEMSYGIAYAFSYEMAYAIANGTTDESVVSYVSYFTRFVDFRSA